MNPTQATFRGENRPVSFPHWADALQRAPVSAAQRDGYRREILAFLRHCKLRHAPATIILAKEYLAEREGQGANGSRESLRWFFRTAPKAEDGGGHASAAPLPPRSGERAAGRAEEEGLRFGVGPGISGVSAGPIAPRPLDQVDASGKSERNATGASRPQGLDTSGGWRDDVPPTAVRDQGGADWERDLIKALRERGLLWRTEETYRGWAARFASFLAPRSPYACEAGDVGAFLSMLAVTQRASRSTQKQAFRVYGFANAVA